MIYRVCLADPNKPRFLSSPLLPFVVPVCRVQRGISHNKVGKVQRWEHKACRTNSAFSFAQDRYSCLCRIGFIRDITFCFLCRCYLANCMLEIFCLWLRHKRLRQHCTTYRQALQFVLKVVESKEKIRVYIWHPRSLHLPDLFVGG